MDNKIRQKMDEIKIPENLHAKSRLGVAAAQSEIQARKKKVMKKSLFAAAGILVMIGKISFAGFLNFENATMEKQAEAIKEHAIVEIPAIEIPEENPYGLVMALIVYNGKLYTRSETEIGAEDGSLLRGEKLGVTKDSITEEKSQITYEKQFASSIGIVDVYEVKGYESGFRLMTYERSDDGYAAHFYENLNGISVANGEDLFSKLKLKGNAVSAEYRGFTDMDRDQGNFQTVDGGKALDSFIRNLDETLPYLDAKHKDPMDQQTIKDDDFREVAIHLKDGSEVKLRLVTGGYIYYGNIGLFFKMDEKKFSEFWSLLQT